MIKFSTYFLFLCLLLSGCVSGTGRIDSTTLDPESEKLVTTAYSEYWEDVQYVAGGEIKIHPMITLGKERVPANYKPDRKIRSSQGEILSVLEIYLVNNSTNIVKLELMGMQEVARLHNVSPKQISLKPGQWTSTDPIVEVTTIYKSKDIPYEINLKINGDVISMSGNLRRLSMVELKRKYGK